MPTMSPISHGETTPESSLTKEHSSGNKEPEESSDRENLALDKNDVNIEILHAATKKKKRPSRSRSRVALLHSPSYTQVLHAAMQHIHQDRDVLLESLLYYCGFLRNTPNFLTVVPPKKATRKHMERFHHAHYLDLLSPSSRNGEFLVHMSNIPHQLLETMGLVEDCALPTTSSERHALWNYCQYVVGASLQAAHLLATDKADVAINWGGGRHHAHDNMAGGFCFVNDIVLAIQYLLKYLQQRILYLDLDIHHCDGVQAAFYDSDAVMTVSFHRHAPGFFPSTSGSTREKGKHNTKGVGYNINVPLPKSCTSNDFLSMFQFTFEKMLGTYDPDVVVLCVGADGLKGDPLVGETDGWNLCPEALAECVRFASMVCGGIDKATKTGTTPGSEDMKKEKEKSFTGGGGGGGDEENDLNYLKTAKAYSKRRKLLVLGGGGYDAANTARTLLLSTAAACESARPGMLWKELPTDIPRHEHFPRYGPEFSLYSAQWITRDESSTKVDGLYQTHLLEAKKAVETGIMYLQSQQGKALVATPDFSSLQEDDPVLMSLARKPRVISSKTDGVPVARIPGNRQPETSGKRRRRRKTKK